VNEVNVVNMWKNATFTPYPYESKKPGERGERCETFFIFCGARMLPN